MRLLHITAGAVEFPSDVGGGTLLGYQAAPVGGEVYPGILVVHVSHVLRAAYFGSFGTAHALEQPWLYAGAIAVAIAGTSLTPLIIERMTDHGFRQWTRAIIMTVSAIYLVRAAWLFWQG